MKRACTVHDIINLALLPLIGGMTVAGLTGLIDPSWVTATFMAYIVADFVWVLVQPEAVPSLPSVILFHHAVTAVLLCIPLKYPHLHTYTCIDGLVEINTWFLIARRQWRSARKAFSWLYWGSFLPMRMVLYPALVPVFLREMREVEGAPWLDTLLCVGCQVILCAFNVVLLALSVMNWRKRSSAAATAAAGGAKGAKTGSSTGAGVGSSVSPLLLASKGAKRLAGGVDCFVGGSSAVAAAEADGSPTIAAASASSKPCISHAGLTLKARAV